ncbi:hypothetical protein ACWD3J_14010 [Streptomyces sp. NPDC002755]
MPKTWQPGEAAKFARQLELDKPYYIVMKTARHMAVWEDPELASTYVFTKRLPLTGNPCTEGDYSAVQLCQNFGPIYDTPPRGIRNIADVTPRVAGPLPAGYEAILDHAEIRGLDKQVADSSNPRKRKLIGSWGV